MQIYPDILGTDAVSDSRQMIIDRENSIKSSFSGPRAPTVTAEDVGCIWYCTADSNFYGLYSIDEDGSNPAWHKLVTPTKLNAMDLGTPTTETLYVDLEGAPCEAKKDMFVLVEHTILPVENYEITNNGMRVTFVSPIPAGLKLEIRWFIQEVIGRDGATFVPSIVNNVLTWDNDQGLVNPPDLDFNANLTEIENFANEQIVAIKDSSDAEIAKINNAGSTQVATVQSNGASQVNLVKQTAQEYINTMDGKITEVLNGAAEAAESAEAAAASAASVDADNIVHKTGNENIAGSKTFTTRLITNNVGAHQVFTTDKNSEYTIDNVRAYREDGITPWFFVGAQKNQNGNYYQRMGIWNNDNTSFAAINVGFKPDGSLFTEAPTPPTSDNSGQIATTANVDAKITAQAVKLLGNQNIGGTKTFTSPIIFQKAGSGSGYYLKNTSLDCLTNPSANQSQYIVWVDKNNRDMSYIQQSVDTNGRVNFHHVASNYKTDGTRVNCTIGCHVNRDGSIFTSAPTPSTSDNSTKIATTQFVNNVLSAIYPVGSLYLTVNSTCPLATLISGSTWVLVSQDRVLQGAGARGSAGGTLEAGLPDHRHSMGVKPGNSGWEGGGALNGTSYTGYASADNPIYGRSDTVQPPAYLINVFRRTA